jgi:predicted enzyme related to lactoylglutathione lyase
MDEQFKQHGAFSWCELMTTDVAAARSFYTKLFGWDTEDMSMTGMSYTVVKAAGKGIGGIMDMPKDAPPGMPPVWGAYVTVDDVDVTAKTAVQLGAKLLVPPQDIPKVGRFCVIQDPQGAVISAITYVEM